MPRDRLTFRQRDVSAAIRAAAKAGLTISEVKISPDGEIVLVTNQGETKVRKRNPQLRDLLNEDQIADARSGDPDKVRAAFAAVDPEKRADLFVQLPAKSQAVVP